MSTKPITEEQLEDAAQGGYLLGQAVGHEDIAGLLREKAGQLFTNGKDEFANYTRELSRDILARGKAKRDAHETHRRLSKAEG